MKDPERVAELLAKLRTLTETDFERHLIDALERDLSSPPTVEVIDTNRKKNPRVIDLTGQRFGRLTVLEYAGSNKSGNALWLCHCDCGNKIIANNKLLRNGNTKSCGCLRQFREQPHKKTHGMSHTRFYSTWTGIKDRCFNVKSMHYPDYGGRGISMFPAWINDFVAFYNYISTLENFGCEGYTLDRIDNNKGYEPNNLRWADAKTQSNNRRNVRLIEYEGELLTISQAAEKSGISRKTLSDRIFKQGDSSEERLFRPVHSSS